VTPDRAPFGTLTPAMTEHARKTAEWSRRVAVCAVAAGVVIVIAALAIGFSVSSGKGPERGLLFGGAVLYLGFGVLTCFIAYLLRRFSTSLEIASSQKSVSALADAFAYESNYWRIVAVITVLSLASTIIGAAVPAFRKATYRSQHRRTVEGIDQIGRALEAYALANSQYPDAGSIDQLAKILEPKFIAHMPRRDGFDRPFDYSAICDQGRCPEYRLSSAGPDGRYETEPRSIDQFKAPVNTGNDYVFANGRYIGKPAL